MTTETNSIPALGISVGNTNVPLTPGQLVWRRFRKHRLALMGAGGIALLILFIIIGSIIVPESKANRGDLLVRLSAPIAGHPFGTDSTGRDVFNRIIYGGETSPLLVGPSVAFGITLGPLSRGGDAPFRGPVVAHLLRLPRTHAGHSS